MADVVHGKEPYTVRVREIRKNQQSVPTLRLTHADHALTHLHEKVRIFADIFLLMALLSYLSCQKTLA